MRFQRLDLNLLVALDVLLAEKSVSLAADRLCLSQSATSSALGRLRDYFGDELLVVKGRSMVLTARAEELIEPVRAVLDQIRSTIAIAPEFDPATCDRQIRFMASDYSTQVLLAGALAMIEAEAPHMRFEIQPMGDSPIDTLERGQIDLLLTIDYAISSDHPSQVLFEDDYVVVGDAANPAMEGDMTREKYFSLGHVTARFGKSRTPAFDDWFVRRQKTQRRIEVVAPTFLSQTSLVVGTKRIATMHRRLASQMVKVLPLVLREVPFDIPPIREAIQWHITNNNDRALRWVVERLAAMAQEERGDITNVVPIAEARRDEIAVQFQHNHPNMRGA
ncbi:MULTISPECIES: LysR family transcriptional regulator [unclassified Novosphingobium]|uniref:LysR family transcriptional regulator n=1 Tax=unclassified Novosphingobium TaxID=2644732 RepID=UPI0008698F60|nr:MULTISPECIES: LysR family transcriptional regulator [unclassified Novosphingobium]MBN9143310.1 LysR family transcriptional regulator [Novosphingobium sp.]MDR6706399.1 DNA-binding transcriptional LysR family regulator [Novosphingobium sp. 1748]ODU82614.1 MAG: transcriptional regulator [Novosphingobium sp. SCN 63-17]OJX89616.1 MAG: transcriptional regulator [Novosphingobium sp. 63-713]